MPESVPGGDPGGELLLVLVQAFLSDRWERHKASKALDETLRRYFLDEDSRPRADRTQHKIDSFLVSVTPLITGHSDGPEECYVEIVDTTRALTDPDRSSVYFYRLGSGRARKITRRI
ncbi:hypothetical protein E4N62_19000 [Streptomyces sp. MNU76]|uniref:hypothetical protein n=1 Tax=Streptomyces sp. MNU76 TaxID=2560026 RepID=UPI001E6020B3|nr:hypothetical protein [Streptomyces sp. MNU76]MCC9707178.1 hypothetical protein [Streptomyces sp. MNU76]